MPNGTFLFHISHNQSQSIYLYNNTLAHGTVTNDDDDDVGLHE